MITTDISGNNLIAINESGNEIVVEIAPRGLDAKSTQLFLEDRKLSRQMTGYTIQDQVNINLGIYSPKQWQKQHPNKCINCSY